MQEPLLTDNVSVVYDVRIRLEIYEADNRTYVEQIFPDSYTYNSCNKVVAMLLDYPMRITGSFVKDAESVPPEINTSPGSTKALSKNTTLRH